MKVSNEVTQEKTKEPYYIISDVKDYTPLQIRFKKNDDFKAFEKVAIMRETDFMKLIYNLSDDYDIELEKLQLEHNNLSDDYKELLDKYQNLKSDYKLIENDLNKTKNENKRLLEYKAKYEVLKSNFRLILNKFILLNENLLNSAIIETIEKTTQENTDQFKKVTLFNRIFKSKINISNPLIKIDNIVNPVTDNIKNEINKEINEIDLLELSE